MTTPYDMIRWILTEIGDDPDRAGLEDTPGRVVKMWKEIFRGYDPEQMPRVTTFMNGDDGIVVDQMIIDSGDFFSHCEHHMVPFFGRYWFAYMPGRNGKILGLSKVARVVHYFAARLQVQERLTTQIVDFLWNQLLIVPDDTESEVDPMGMILVMEAQHLCKTMRGARVNGKMTTSCLKGVFREQETRNEFFQIIGRNS